MALLGTFNICNSDRQIGAATADPDGFVVINLSSQNVFVVSGGVWAAGSASSIPAALFDVWSSLTTIYGDANSGSSSDAPASTSYTYYIDPIDGLDSNDGTDYAHAWLTTAPADTVVLTGSQSIGYLSGSTWVLYRKLNMTADQANLAASLVNSPASSF